MVLKVKEEAGKPNRMIEIATAVSSSEKAGVGGSTPSLATISLNGLENPLKISHL